MSRGPCSSARVGVMGILLHPFFPVEDSWIPASPGLSQQLPEEDSRIPAQLLSEETFSTLPSTDSGNFEDGLRSWKKGAGSIWEPPEEEFHEKSNQLQGIPSFSCWNEGEGDSPILQQEVPEAPAFPKKKGIYRRKLPLECCWERLSSVSHPMEKDPLDPVSSVGSGCPFWRNPAPLTFPGFPQGSIFQLQAEPRA